MANAHYAFDMLRDALKHRYSKALDRKSIVTRDIDHQAMFVWSALHGLVSIMRSDIASSLNIGGIKFAISNVLNRIGKAIDGELV